MTDPGNGRNSSSKNGSSAGAVAKAGGVISWYKTSVRPVLQELAPERLDELERDIGRVDRLITSLGEERDVCFLGNSGVGKSTLINALVAGRERVLPQGGIGPLTALETTVRYSDERYFEATYLPITKLHNLLFALERNYEAELRKQGTRSIPSGDDIGSLLDPEERAEIETTVPQDEGASGDEPLTRMEAYRKQARLLIYGDQNGGLDMPYLLDCLRLAARQEPRWQTNPAPDDQVRIDRLRACLASGKDSEAKVRRQFDDGRKLFVTELRDHASGFLAPLIKKLDVGWNADLLRDGLVLVDLPGLGVANDEYRAVTLRWVRERARGIALVVDRSGLREAEAELLRSTGFLGRLLHSLDDPGADPVDLLVIAVKLDLSADDAWRHDRDYNPDEARPWPDYLDQARDKAKQLALSQLRAELERMRASLAESTRGDFQEAVSRVLGTVQVHAVSAPQFAKFLANDPEDRARIATPEQSGIPSLQSALAGISQRRQQTLERVLSDTAENFHERLRSTLELIRAGWEDDSRTVKEIEELSSELDQFLDPLRRDLHSRQGQFREFLRETLPLEIEALVVQASSSAEDEIEAYLNSLGTAHWNTLRAAVRRGGCFHGARKIELPADFSLRFELAVAPVWSRKILARLRKRTAELAEDYIKLVDRTVEWADERKARVQPRVVRALRDKMEADTKELSNVGREGVDELREKVKNKLLSSIEGPIRRRCQNFVEKRLDQGVGTKHRILTFFAELVPNVVEAARLRASEVLNDNFRLVVEEINEVFKNYPDPLETAAEAIVSSHETRLKRSDSDKRKRVLDFLASTLSTDPYGTNRSDSFDEQRL